ncbi:MAG: iron-containing alcohol dehydrogenase [Coriobacteriia bacterium]|nr:iron-containing alcohol dehydrogenase [Coriobacteriia bacterium]
MIPNYYEFRAATKILSGEHAIEHVPYELANLGVTRVLVITDERVRSLGLVQPLLDAVGDSDVVVAALFDEVPVDSSVAVANKVAEEYAAAGCNGIIAVGGGSVLDTAKGAAIVLAAGGADLMTMRGSEVLTNPALPPLVAVPTTAGTGSEVTGAAVIKDTVREVKMAFVSFDLAPTVAVLDPRMTLQLPPRITASTAMDALVHSVEAASGRQANPLSDAYAHAAITLVREHLAPVLRDGSDPQRRLALANAALMAGIAFSNSMVGGVHALGHACGAIAHVAHGDAMAILLPHVMRFNLEVAADSYAALLLPLAGPVAFAAAAPDARAAAAIDAVEALLDVGANAGLPRRLADVGVTAEQLDAIAHAAINDGSVAFNPRELTLTDAAAILKAAL